MSPSAKPEDEIDLRTAVVVLNRSTPLPVVIIDVVPSYRLGLAAAFADAGFKTEEPVDLDEWAGLPGPRVVLITVAAPDDCELIRRFAGVSDDLLVVTLLRQPTAEMYVRALQAGAAGAASWTSAPEAVIAAVQAARDRHVLLPQDIVRAIAAGIRLSADLRAIAPAEIKWLQMMGNGHTISELARAVGYSEREMFRLLRQLYDRMGVQNRTEALLKAAHCGLLS